MSACTDNNRGLDSVKELKALKQELEDLKDLKNERVGKFNTFLTFQKEDAEDAMNYYVKLFENSEIISVKRWGAGAPSKEGTIMHASFILDGHNFMCSDSPAIHEWGFTPAVSVFVECKDNTELEKLFKSLSEKGKVMMPLNNYGFSQKFGFVEDRFGVCWQLNLE